MKNTFYLLISFQLLNALLAFNVGNANTRHINDNHNKIELRQNRLLFNRDQEVDTEDKPQFNRGRSSMLFELDQVESGCSSNPCLNEGVCTTTQNGGFECKCPWGWSGVRCEVCLTECASNPCTGNKKCKAKYGGGYECVCPADRVGLDCEIQNDLCSSNPCLNDGVCKPIEGGSFTCVCQKPWAGENCEKIWENPCTEEVLRSSEMVQFRDPWERTSYLVCTDISIYHSMSCSAGTYFNEKLHHCVPEGYDPPVCPDKHCKNDADCILDEKNNFRCICKKGFRGELCEENIDECALGGNDACVGGTCVDQVNGYYCRCSNGIGLDCKNTIANPCTSDNLEHNNEFHELKSSSDNVFLHCISENTFVVNKCPENLFWHPEERTCTVEKAVLKSGNCMSFPCKNAGECQDSGDGSFKCLCKNGYTGKFCEEMIDFCESNPCINGGRCLPYAGGYTCVCPDKIIDECCCHGILNPCPPKSKLIPGVNNYFPHLFPNRYLHCDFDGRAFARSCAPHLKWRQELLSCMPEDVSIETINSIAANRTNKLIRIKPAISNPVNTVVSPFKVAPETLQPVMINQIGLPKLAPVNAPVNRVLQPVKQEYSGYENYNQGSVSKAARINNQLRDEIRQSSADLELDQVEDQQKQQEQIQKQQEQIQQQQQFVQQQQLQQQQQLEQQQQRDKQQQEQDKKQRELEQQRQQQELEQQKQQLAQQQQQVAQQQAQIAEQQKLQQQQDQKQEEELRKHLQQMNQGTPVMQDEEDQTIIDKMKQERDQRQREQDQREQQFQLQVQQQQQEQQRLQMEQQRQQIQQQFAFQKQQTLQEQQEQQRQQQIQTQFQQQLKQGSAQTNTAQQSPRVKTVQVLQNEPLELDQTVSQLKQNRDQRQREQDQREQQFQLQVQQQQQEQQRLQMEQQRQQIQQQFAFQKQQTLQEQQEQQRQQQIQTQFQQQLKQQQLPPVAAQQQAQLPSSFRSVLPNQLEQDQLTSKMKQERDQRQREQDQREQQFQLQVQQQQQEQQRLQIEQQRQQIQQQFAFQKQQTLQEQQEQQRQQQIQTQFQQQLNTNKQQLPQSFRLIQQTVQPLQEDETPISVSNLNQGFTAGSVLNTPSTPKVGFSKSSNLYFKPTFTSSRKQPIFRSNL